MEAGERLLAHPKKLLLSLNQLRMTLLLLRADWEMLLLQRNSRAQRKLSRRVIRRRSSQR